MMKNVMVTLFISLFTVAINAQEPFLETYAAEAVFELEDGRLIVISDDIQGFNKNLELEFTSKGQGTSFNRSYFLSKSEEIIFEIQLNYSGSNAVANFNVTAGRIGEDLAPLVELEGKGREVFKTFVSDSHINFFTKLVKQKTKNGEDIEMKWLQFDADLNRTEKAISIPSYGKKMHEVNYDFVGENNGTVYFINNYVPEDSEANAKTVLMTISPDGTVNENDISNQMAISKKCVDILNQNEGSVAYKYIELTNQIAYQYIAADEVSAKLGLMSVNGEIIWERTEKLPKRYKLSTRRVTSTYTRSSLVVVNQSYLLYKIVSVSAGSGHCALVDLEDGDGMNEFDFEIENYLEIPSGVYLACMLNPDGEGKAVIQSIQESVKKAKKLRNYTMGYKTSSKNEYLWITEDRKSKMYRFELQ